MTHTPGPWEILRLDLGDEEICSVPVAIRGGNGRLVVDNEGGLAPEAYEWTVEEIEANAALIAAAPDMKEALEWYAEKVLNCRKITREGDKARNDLDYDGGRRARIALEKARGEE